MSVQEIMISRTLLVHPGSSFVEPTTTAREVDHVIDLRDVRAAPGPTLDGHDLAVIPSATALVVDGRSG